MLKVRDMPADAFLLTDSQDIASSLELIGQPGDARYYGCLFVILDDSTADYKAVYGCPSNAPRPDAPLDLLWPVDTLSDGLQDAPGAPEAPQ